MTSLILLGFFALAVLAPLDVFSITSSDGRVIYRTYPAEGCRVVLKHLNSIYQEEVAEILEIKDGHFVLKEVMTDSPGIKEYYGLTDEIPRRAWREISFHNSSGRDFHLSLNGYAVLIIDGYKDRRLTLRLTNADLLRLLYRRQ